MQFEYSAPVFGGKEREYMKKRIKYTDEPMGEFRIVKNFLPPPERLILKDDNVKVTISLSKTSIEFFKRMAKKNKTQYQKMIRRVLDSRRSSFPIEPRGSIGKELRRECSPGEEEMRIDA
jgi:hypothetical protein